MLFDHAEQWTQMKDSQQDTMECIEDIDIDSTISDAYLHRRLPEEIVGTQTTFYHHDKRFAREEKDDVSPPKLVNRGMDGDSRL